MKMLMVHFYQSVIGADTKNFATETAERAMQRLQIPVLKNSGSERAYRYVEANDELLAKARASWAAEEEKRSDHRGNGHAHTRPVDNDEVIAMLTKIDDGIRRVEALAANTPTAAAIVALDDAVMRTEAKLDSLIHHLQPSQARTRRKG